MLDQAPFMNEYTEDLRYQIAFRPDDTVDWLGWCTTNGTNGECLRSRLGEAVEAFGSAFDDWLYLTQVSCCTGLYEWN